MFENRSLSRKMGYQIHLKERVSFKSLILIAITIITISVFSNCEGILTVEEAASKASEEFCTCLKKNSMSTCEAELNNKYRSHLNNDKFYKEFNKVNNCGVYIYRKN
jgi:hypothetical protein